ncbi:hypothetical protein TNCV_3068291 [Trichonephila clavipes]|nr:hypothetical protein TNCV_3068291 [Trichonephila clavipes]
MKSPCLKYFNGNKAVTVSVDVRKNGLGAVLLQEGQPVAYGSVSLTQTQQRHAQIEKELMAVIYGLEHFNYYTYGRIVTIQTDHKPILELSKKPYDTISARLQRLLLRLNKHNIQLEYVPGKNLTIADALSRAQSTTDNFDEVLGQEATVRINLLTQASPNKWEEIASLKAGDPEMQDVLFHINNGWPQEKKTKIAAQPYWHCKEELYSTKEGIICRGQRLVVPVKYRKEIFKLLHVSHKSIVSSKIKAREYFYWPNLNRDVEEYMSKCKICQKYQRENQKEILINPEIPGRAWIQPEKDMPSPAELLMGRKLRTFLPSHPGQLKPTFDVENAREALRKRQIIQNKYANKHATVLPVLHQNGKVWFKHKMKEPWKQGTMIQVGPQPPFYRIKGENEGVFRSKRFHIRQDNTEYDNPRWLRTVDLYNSDATEISRIPNDSADGQKNASPKPNRSLTNNFRFQLKHLELWFQQDGATCHATIDLLKDTFGDRLISRFGPVNWPPRSCDLTPLDYFLRGYVKSLVYADKPQTLDHLEDNIRRVIADIRPQMLEKVIENWTSRLDSIRASRGSPMPEIIFKM